MTFPDPPVLLMQPGAFTCPRCGGTDAVAQLVNAGQLSAPLAGFCNRCEHHYQFTTGSPSTTTTGVANVQGATALTEAAGAGFVTVGAFVVIDSTSVDGGAELVTVSSAGSGTSIPVANTPLRLTHTAGCQCADSHHDAARPNDLTCTDLGGQLPLFGRFEDQIVPRDEWTPGHH